jgi:2-polyprenyl-6-methoxyphenol hydroxylase-like FAD-dependent oxidoreductase
MIQSPSTAIVIGGSIAGLLAARALASRFARVTVLERDDYPLKDVARRGVPHGRHAHGLLAGGLAAMERLLPGLAAELVAAGAASGDLLADTLWINHGGRLASVASGLTGVLASRPLIEGAIRRRVARQRNIEILTGFRVTGLCGEASAGRVTGVEAELLADGGRRAFEAALVVDASGRGSRVLDWLGRLGEPAPPEDRIEMALTYSTVRFRRQESDAGGKRAIVVRTLAPSWRSGVALAQEGQEWVVTLGGYLGDDPGRSLAAMSAFARSLPDGCIGHLIETARLPSPVEQFRCPASRRRRFERLPRHPEGFLVIGDALACFNPAYGQGMTVAALEAEALATELAAGTPGLAARFYRAAAALIEAPWQMAACADLANPAVAGDRPPATLALNRYMAALHRAAEQDGVLARRFMRVANLIEPPSALLSPSSLMRTLVGQLRARGGPHEVPDAGAMSGIEVAPRLPRPETAQAGGVGAASQSLSSGLARTTSQPSR